MGVLAAIAIPLMLTWAFHHLRDRIIAIEKRLGMDKDD